MSRQSDSATCFRSSPAAGIFPNAGFFTLILNKNRVNKFSIVEFIFWALSSACPANLICAMKVFTYIIQSLADSSYYTGITINVQKRLYEHNEGTLKTTALKRPWNLMYVKPHNSYLEARKHEKWLKKKNRKYKVKLAG